MLDHVLQSRSGHFTVEDKHFQNFYWKVQWGDSIWVLTDIGSVTKIYSVSCKKGQQLA